MLPHITQILQMLGVPRNMSPLETNRANFRECRPEGTFSFKIMEVILEQKHLRSCPKALSIPVYGLLAFFWEQGKTLSPL